MRICFVSHANSHFTQPYVDYFARHGHEVHLVSLSQPGLPQAVNHHPLKKPVDPEKDKLSYLWALPKVRALIQSLRPDVVHAHYVTSNGMLAAFSKWKPLVVSIHGTDIHSLHNPLRYLMCRYALREADLVNPVSRSFEKKLLALGVPSTRILTLTQGIDLHRVYAERTSRRPGPVRLLCTRTLVPHYNCLQIVRALSILQARGIQFHCTFAADGPEKPCLAREVVRQNLSESVTFLDGYSQDELPSILNHADIYVSAAPLDGTSISLLEAMASGAFPVVSDITANQEWLTGRGDCLFFDPNDPRKLAGCLEVAIRDGNLRQKAVEVNRQRVIARGDRGKNLALLADAYQMLMGRFKK